MLNIFTNRHEVSEVFSFTNSLLKCLVLRLLCRLWSIVSIPKAALVNINTYSGARCLIVTDKRLLTSGKNRDRTTWHAWRETVPCLCRKSLSTFSAIALYSNMNRPYRSVFQLYIGERDLLFFPSMPPSSSSSPDSFNLKASCDLMMMRAGRLLKINFIIKSMAWWKNFNCTVRFVLLFLFFPFWHYEERISVGCSLCKRSGGMLTSSESIWSMYHCSLYGRTSWCLCQRVSSFQDVRTAVS